ncbi:thiolase family protein [Ancylobacter dichloromethanicus]|uniref:Acetyl-CoA acetyltransferase n=1 Tax=Ancylobacter dichloromethanicus TaxID=518825 RepID=A0A9W6N0S1_9HYPH|nr:beta-ketoacyl synthase N-terminal-like domain-containing protein [Ancylobacter dichloromethanicus]MBS7552357.1 thiolase family protein [Ancylobacter dichloromethanicus]GLK74094.1 acetyl-CoA acetyltransferase [Ancylobacter dichloromethanicus]
MSGAFILAARRTAVAPRGGAFRAVEAHDLAAPVLRACLSDAGRAPHEVEHVILGNALSGGGNVARLAALAAGLPASVPALTLDTQCCSGLDAIQLAARMVEAGAAELVLAGGVESFSRSPLRAVRPKAKGEAPVFYDRPPFTPWPARDPDMIEVLAKAARGLSRAEQAAFAIESHAKALAARARLEAEIVPVAGLSFDSFTRALTPALCARAPVLYREGETELDAAGVAVEADAAAVVLVASQEWAERRLHVGRPVCEVFYARSFAAAPEDPPAAIDRALAETARDTAFVDIDNTSLGFMLEWSQISVVELMEASAGQALKNCRWNSLDPATLNRGGGALARGHPIGASGAILAVRLFHELAGEAPGALGLAAIAAAGGLGSALMLQRV